MERRTKHVVMFSTGLSSAYLASVVIGQYSKENTIILLTDTRWEDEDNYRFMRDVMNRLGMPATVMKDGRTPEQVFFDEHLLKTPYHAKCSEILKMKQTVIFVEGLRSKGFEPILYFGISEHEAHRAPRIAYKYSHNMLEPLTVRFPLMELGTTNKDYARTIEGVWGIRKPRMYDLGFSHSNCGGRCIKGGIKHYMNLYRVWPDRYKEQEEMEERFIREIAPYTILKRRGEPFTLRQLREEMEAQMTLGLPDEELERLVSMDEEEMPCECVV